jgi:hypothetical protein
MGSSSVGGVGAVSLAATSWAAYLTAASRPDTVQHVRPVDAWPAAVAPAPVPAPVPAAENGHRRLDTYA